MDNDQVEQLRNNESLALRVVFQTHGPTPSSDPAWECINTERNSLGQTNPGSTLCIRLKMYRPGEHLNSMENPYVAYPSDVAYPPDIHVLQCVHHLTPKPPPRASTRQQTSRCNQCTNQSPIYRRIAYQIELTQAFQLPTARGIG